MWSRRVLRAGWLIAPIFEIPGNILRGIRKAFRKLFFSYDGEFETSFTCFIVLIVSMVSFFIYTISHQNDKYTLPANPDNIKEAMADPCAQQKLTDRLRVGMIRQWDIDEAKSKCAAEREQEKQLQLMEQQKQMLGIK